MSTKEEEEQLTLKVQELKNLRPEMIGISKLFTLDDSSKLVELIETKPILTEPSGDVGGSNALEEED